MRKKLLIFIIFCSVNLVNGQDYGVLTETTLSPFLGWNGSHAGLYSINIGVNSIHKTSNTSSTIKIQYDYFYVNDTPSLIICSSSTSGNINNTDCGPIDENILYNKDTFSQGFYQGCIGSSEIYGIHLSSPGADNNRCIEDSIILDNGWNWQYSYDGISWIDFDPAFQGQRTISFKIKDLIGYQGKTKIYFHTGYQTQFANTISYNIISCSPALATNPETTLTKCDDSSDGSVKLTFASQIADDQKLLIGIFTDALVPQFIKSIPVLKSEIINNAFTWTNIGKGTYSIKYQAQKSTDNSTIFVSSAVQTPVFTIGSPQPLTFSVSAINPNCYDGTGQITINASGGTPPYYYTVNNQEVQFTSPITIPASTGDTIIKVRDTNNCIDKAAND